MNRYLHSLLWRPSHEKCLKKVRRKVWQARPELERLEERQVPTVTYNGGALLPHVEVQPLYLGMDWYTNASYRHQIGFFNHFLKDIVNSSYMDMLSNAGYNVSRGSIVAGGIASRPIDKTQYLSDSQIQQELIQVMIYNHHSGPTPTDCTSSSWNPMSP